MSINRLIANAGNYNQAYATGNLLAQGSQNRRAQRFELEQAEKAAQDQTDLENLLAGTPTGKESAASKLRFQSLEAEQARKKEEAEISRMKTMNDVFERIDSQAELDFMRSTLPENLTQTLPEKFDEETFGLAKNELKTTIDYVDRIREAAGKGDMDTANILAEELKVRQEQSRANLENTKAQAAARRKEGDLAGAQAAAIPVTKTALNNLQKDQISAEIMMASLDAALGKYDPRFLTRQGQISAMWKREKDKVGLDLDADEKAFLAKNRAFKEGVSNIFNQYRRMITGAAASVQELDQLEEAILNKNLSPTEFESSARRLKHEIARGMRIRDRLMQSGFDVASEDGKLKLENAVANDVLINPYVEESPKSQSASDGSPAQAGRFSVERID